MYYNRNELLKKYKYHNALSERYFNNSCDWRKYSKEEKDNFWKLYQKHADIAYNYLCAISACEFDGVIFVADEEFE